MYMIFMLLGMGLSMMAAAQKSIDFKSVSFAEALQMSAATGKPVFIDCYTSWCAPCKRMDQTVFVNDTVRTFYDKHFINLKIDMEKGEGVDLAKKYQVGSFPTYLYLNAKGELIHRSASLMPANEFIEEGKKALSPASSYSALLEKYQQGDRSGEVLFQYAVALEKVNRGEAQKVQRELMEQLTDSDLHSEFGWRVIRKFSMSESDRLGGYLLGNRAYFESLAGRSEVQTVLNRLKMADMYRLIREGDSTRFFVNLQEMKQDKSNATRRNVTMLEMQFYLQNQQADAFVETARAAMNGVLEHNDSDLSFIARRAIYDGKGNKNIAQQALELARKAVELNPEEYSNQGTLGSICLELGLKEEGLKAARKARELANESTSKIQKIAQELVDQLEAL